MITIQVRNHFKFLSVRKRNRNNLFKGLEGSPEIISKTMSKNVSPEKAAESAVFINGGYDECSFGVGVFCH